MEENKNLKPDEIIKVDNNDGKGNPYRHSKNGQFASKDGQTEGGSIDQENSSEDLDEIDISKAQELDFDSFFGDDDDDDEDEPYHREMSQEEKDEYYNTEKEYLIPQINATKNLKRVQEKEIKRWQPLHSVLGVSKEVVVEFQNRIKNIVDHGQLGCFVPPDVLYQVLKEQKLYSQIYLSNRDGKIHGKGARGPLAIQKRIELDNNNHGLKISEMLNGKANPISGVLLNHKISEMFTSGATFYTGYGIKCGFIFDKQKLIDNNTLVTYTIGDTLDKRDINRPTLLGDVIDSRILGNCVNKKGEHYYNKWDAEDINYAIENKNMTRVSDLIKPLYESYIEAQYCSNDGLSLKCASAFCTDDITMFNNEKGKEMYKMLQDLGIKVYTTRYLEHKDGYEQNELLEVVYNPETGYYDLNHIDEDE